MLRKAAANPKCKVKHLALKLVNVDNFLYIINQLFIRKI